MSFSIEQKYEIIDSVIKQQCCKMAQLHGILSSSANIVDGKIVIAVFDKKIAEYIQKTIFEVYNKWADISTRKSGGRGFLLTFESNSALKYITDFENKSIVFQEKCAACLSAFLRGVFLATGRITDPSKQYLLELAIDGNTEIFMEYLDSLGLNPRLTLKAQKRVIYFKNSTNIEDFLALSGLNSTAFTLMNEKIQSEIRNNVNRISNCETNNIERAVSASIYQITLIERLIEKGLISQLSPELEQTARLRLLYRDYSLSQLAAVFTPHITKPGLSHRLKKITTMAEQLLEGKLDDI